MPDTYVTIPTENGSINISEDVISAIASAEVSEIEGVVGLSAASGIELMGKRSTGKGLRVSFEGETVLIDASVLVRQGTNIAAAAERIQRAVTAAVESTTGLRSVVNVHVAGVVFDK